VSDAAASPVFERVAVLGLGLLGGSVALAARRSGAAGHVAGATRQREVLERALRDGAIDRAGSAEEVVRDADLVVLATPVFAMPAMLRELAPALAQGAIVTDVGSVKAGLAETLPGLLPRGVHYVGSHPMAGSHERGLDAARADLFQDAACVVMNDGPAEARDRVAAFWAALGSRVVLREPAGHDAEVAWTSHLPHLLAFAFAEAFDAAPASAREVAGAGFRDFTRIAHSDPELWADIVTANRKSIAAPLQAVAETLQALARALDADDAEAVERIVAAGRAALARGTVRSPDSPDNTNPRRPQGPGGAKENETK
jgi:prephenate dehydrogenase